MPAWPKLKVRLLADLAEQLRFAPKPAVVKDISRAISTLDIIDSTQSYPSDWVIFRITGYREDAGDSTMVEGQALKSDLPRLVERLSAQSKLRADDLASLGPGLSQQELIAEWKVNRKTLERYRTKGLLALRLLSSRGKSSLFFPSSSTRRFKQDHAASFNRPAFSRLSKDEADSLKARAARLTKRTSSSRTRIASHLALRSKRARATVDRLLKTSLPVKKSKKRLKPAARPRILDRWDAGANVGDIAKSLKKSRAAAIRAINLARAERLERWDPVARIPSDYAAQKSVHALAEIAASHPRAAIAVAPPPERDLQSLLDAMSIRELVPREEERDLLFAHHDCMLLAARNQVPVAEKLDTAETALRWAAKLRAILIRPHRAVIVESLESLVSINILRADPALLTAALFHALRAGAEALELFTPSDTTRREIGGRLAAPIALTVSKSLADWVNANQRQFATLKSRHDPNRAARALSAVTITDWTDQTSPWQPALSRKPKENTPPNLAEILRLRFGLQSTRPHTTTEIANTLNLTRIRAAQKIQQAIQSTTP